MVARAHSPALSWDRSAVLLLVIALHIGGFWLVCVYGGLGVLIEKTIDAIQFVDLPSVDKPRVEPTTEPPRLIEAHYEPVPVVDLVLPEIGTPPGDGEITVQSGGGETHGSGTGPVFPTIAPTALTWRQTRPIDDFYPPISIRMEETGAAVLRVCVDEAGRLQRAPEVEASSGHARLDAAAVAWASESLVFTSATDNGVRVASCKGFRVRFKLH